MYTYSVSGYDINNKVGVGTVFRLDLAFCVSTGTVFCLDLAFSGGFCYCFLFSRLINNLIFNQLY